MVKRRRTQISIELRAAGLGLDLIDFLSFHVVFWFQIF